MWEASEFLIAGSAGVHSVAGYTYKGLGMHIAVEASPKGRRPPVWCLTHLGSGHGICRIPGNVTTAFPIASEIAEIGDWSFDGLTGWLNRDPDLLVKSLAIIEKNKCQRGYRTANDTMARLIAVARAGCAAFSFWLVTRINGHG